MFKLSHAHTCTHAHSDTRTHMHIYMYAHMQTHAQINTQTNTCTYTHTRTHAHAHTSNSFFSASLALNFLCISLMRRKTLLRLVIPPDSLDDRNDLKPRQDHNTQYHTTQHQLLEWHLTRAQP